MNRIRRYVAVPQSEGGVMTPEQMRMLQHYTDEGDLAALGALGDSLADAGFPNAGAHLSLVSGGGVDAGVYHESHEGHPGKFRFFVARDGADLLHLLHAFDANGRGYRISRRVRPQQRMSRPRRYAVIGGQNPTVNIQLPVPAPVPRTPPQPMPAAAPHDLRPAPGGMGVPAVEPQPTAFILPWVAGKKKRMSRLPRRKLVVRKYARAPVGTPFHKKLLSLRPEIAAEAQKAYDPWDASDPEYGDCEVGFGGICQDVAEGIGDVLNRHGIDSKEMTSQVGEQHVWQAARDPDTGHVYHIDISPHHYETGGGYNWKKIPGVQFGPEHVDIEPGYPEDFEDEF